MDFCKLGATLYVPATNIDIISIANKEKYSSLRSVVFCMEDSILEHELPFAIKNICKSLVYFEKKDIYRFVRPRNPANLKVLLDIPNISRINGFVFPKITIKNIDTYFKILKHYPNFKVMLTLETEEVFNINELYKLWNLLKDDFYKERIITIRIGGLDLLNVLGIRRDCERTIYDTPIGHTISQLVTLFKPLGYNLSAPAYESLENIKILREEVERDLLNGLLGKTAIHPNQIDIIQSLYKISQQDFEMAQAIIDPNSPAVFRMFGVMCEKATHWRWAQGILKRGEIYGVNNNLKDINTDKILSNFKSTFLMNFSQFESFDFN
ncbi:MAG: HpcH/HpaI aldolase/citrate lyase family protein [Desulfobacterales bacterium]|nr:HpcH/HpaI aldolase/citrate lyase family protein [Desulfobacterales bacterium]